MKTNMLLIIFMGLIAKLALICDGCDVGSWGVDSFDWNQVRISVLIHILTYQLLKLLLEFIFDLCFH
jgi:hypothetical protein